MTKPRVPSSQRPAPDAQKRGVLARIRLPLLFLVLGLMLVPGLALVLVPLGYPGGLLDRPTRRLLAAAEAYSGRHITVGHARLRLNALGRPIDVRSLSRFDIDIDLELRDVTVAAASGQTGPAALPLVTLRSVNVGLDLPLLLRSLGHDLRITHLRADDLTLTVVRLGDRRLSYDDILTRLRLRQARAAQAALANRLPSAHRHRPTLLEQVALLQISGAALRFYDLTDSSAQATPGQPVQPLQINQIDLAAQQAQRRGEVLLHLSAALDSPAHNLFVDLAVEPPAGRSAAQELVALRAVQVDLQSLALWPWVTHLPPNLRATVEQSLRQLPDWVALKDVVLSGHLLGQPLDDRYRLHGSVEAAGLAVAGVALRARVAGDAELVPETGGLFTLDAQDAELSLNGESARGRLLLRGLPAAVQVPELALRADGMELRPLSALLAGGPLPAAQDWRLSGPAALRLSGGGSRRAAWLDLDLDLARASLHTPMLRKPAGMPLSLTTRLRFTAAAARNQGIVRVERLGLRLGGLATHLSGTLAQDGAVDLRLHGSCPNLAALLEALPRLRQALPRSAQTGHSGQTGHAGHGAPVTLQGGATLTAHVVATPRRRRRHQAAPHMDFAVDGALALQGAHIALAPLFLDGSGQTNFHITSHDHALELHGDIDLQHARLRLPGVNKPDGLPLGLVLRAHGYPRTSSLLVDSADLTVPGGRARFSGSFSPGTLDMQVQRAEVDMDRLSVSFPVFGRKNLPWGRVGLLGVVSGRMWGDPRKAAALRAHVEQVAVSGPLGQLRGGGEIIGFGRRGGPQVRFDLTGTGVDLQRLYNLVTPLPPLHVRKRSLGGVDVAGVLRLDRLRLFGVNASQVVLDAAVHDSQVEIRGIGGSALDGEIDIGPALLDLAQEPPRFALRARLDNVDLGALVALGGPVAAGRVRGHGGLLLMIDGPLSPWPVLGPVLHGSISLAVREGVVRDVTMHAHISNRAIGRMMGHHGDFRQHRAELPIDGLSMQGDIGGGELRITTPLRFVNREVRAAMTGSIGLTGAQPLALHGRLELLPAAISSGTRGRLHLAGAVPINLRVTGDAKLPVVELDNLNTTVQGFLGGLFGVRRRPDVPLPATSLQELVPHRRGWLGRLWQTVKSVPRRVWPFGTRANPGAGAPTPTP